MAEDEGQAAGPRGFQHFEVRAAAGHPEDPRHPGPQQALDDQLSDGRHAAEGYAPASRASTGSIRSSAFLRLASELA